MSSIIQKWSPVTRDFGLIRAPLEKVVNEFTNWHFSIGIEYERLQINTLLSDAFDSLLPLSHSKMRTLFVATKSEWVAFFQNGIQGSDPGPPMNQLSRRINAMSMRICTSPSGAKYSAVIWSVYAPGSFGGDKFNHRRSLAAANDGGKWVFEQSGEPFPFESIAAYDNAQKRDCFSQEMLCEYLKHFGIQPFDDDFFVVHERSPATKLQRRTKVWNAPEFNLEEVVSGKPWERK
jgi:hypothetical protein